MWNLVSFYAGVWGISPLDLYQWLWSHTWVSITTLLDMIGRDVKPFYWVYRAGVLVLTDGRVDL